MGVSSISCSSARVRGLETCDRIPYNDSGESISVASWVRARRDVLEARLAAAIRPRFEEAKRGRIMRKQEVIKQ